MSNGTTWEREAEALVALRIEPFRDRTYAEIADMPESKEEVTLAGLRGDLTISVQRFPENVILLMVAWIPDWVPEFIPPSRGQGLVFDPDGAVRDLTMELSTELLQASMESSTWEP